MFLDVITIFALDTSAASTGSSLPEDPVYPSINGFYQRYSQYPEYCSTPQHMENRRIPPLQNNPSPEIGDTQLIHVTAVIRHGARTPWSADMYCWDGYWEDQETGVWDCNLTTFMAQPMMTGGNQETRQPTCLFEKRYDALLFPQDQLTNELNGTCQMGQLLYQGYEQQLQNGKILREAYGYHKGEFTHDERMRLIDLSLQDYVPWHHDHLHFRADDDQRTVMSGQVLLRSLFQAELVQVYQTTNQYPVIPLHIADRDRDILDANDRACPRLKQIQDQATQSQEYQDFDNSPTSQEVRRYMFDRLKMSNQSRNSILDCLMCTICTDRPLPEAINDYDGSNNNWFAKLAEYDIQTYTKLMKYNDSEYAKLALGPLWYEIMRNINPFLVGSSNGHDEEQVKIKAPKFALFSGHDTTIMPLLASLGTRLWNDTDWVPYATLMTIEIHELIDRQSDAKVYTSNFAFRLLYNGKVLTALVQGCPENADLCDIIHFQSKVNPIATRNTDCSVPDDPTKGSGSAGFWSLESSDGMALLATLVIVSGLCGSLLTLLTMNKRFSRYSGRSKVDNNNAWTIDDDDDYGLELPEGDFQDEPAK
ncbi:histidine phosphatase superfamily branch 2 protein [Nitzschia inconspicua]|uniref:Histidine phosphatase superfamily branch 2 protein n=1 Tax=Nitzschia inconspicua TaxID=303405 RepID=A0A9K3Q331_9STRA|nr:histidine phosphatase superfamily branch 2 protein [Nitzschia inconspicua]